MIRTMIPVALSVFALVACSSDGGSSGGTGGGGPDGGGSGNGEGGNAPPTGAVPDTLVEGNWELPCRPVPNEEGVGSRSTALQITEQVFQLFEFAYGDTNCMNEIWLVTATGTFSEQLIEDGRRPEDGIPVDLKVDSVVLEPLQGPVADSFNGDFGGAGPRCGITNWVVGVDQQVSGSDANPSGCDQVRDSFAPRTDYNRFFVDDGGTPDERADDTLALGTLGSQTDESNRPQGVNREVLFTRRPGSL